MKSRKPIYKINDFVYLTPPDSKSLQYYIGRIMDIQGDQVQVAWFYRAKDVIHLKKKIVDARLLLATMNTDKNHISTIRGKCRVEHLDKIRDLENFKNQPDCFYYDQYYDQYTQKFYQVVPLVKVQNLPDSILLALKRYEFILIEAGKQINFIEKRVCYGCKGWCNPNSPIVSCVDCLHIYHLQCARLAREPTKGYAWECVDCLSKDSSFLQLTHVDEYHGNESMNEENQETNETGQSSEIDNSNYEMDNESLEKIQNHLKATEHVKLPFPWRYFGEYSKFQDLLSDSEGRPKASSRIGRSYQAIHIPECISKDASLPLEDDVSNGALSKNNSPSSSASSGNNFKKRDKRKKNSLNENELEIHSRGTPSEVFFSNTKINQDTLDNYINQIHSHYHLSQKNANLIDVSLLYLKTFRYQWQDALASLTMRSLKDLLADHWTSKEITTFEESVIQFGLDLSIIKPLIPTKTMKQLVEFHYKWKKSNRYIPVYSQYCKEFRPSKRFTKSRAIQDENQVMSTSDSESDVSDTESLILAPTDTELHCTFCYSYIQDHYQTRFYQGTKSIFCKECNLHWMKYGNQRPECESLIKLNKEKGLKRKNQLENNKKKKKTCMTSKQSVEVVKDVETKDLKNEPCAVCCSIEQDKENMISSCTFCQLRVHKHCYGLNETQYPLFACDKCENTRHPTSHLNYECVLCYRDMEPYVSALKRTIGHNWVHMICALWTQGITFTNPQTLDSVIGMGQVHDNHSKSKSWCCICEESGKGITIQCHERSCTCTFHVSCAFKDSNYKLAMESSRRSLQDQLQANAYCPTHANRKNKRDSLPSHGPSLYHQFIQSKIHNGMDMTLSEKRAHSMCILDTCDCHFSKPRKKTMEIIEPKASDKSCMSCSSTISFIWWPVGDAFYTCYLCHLCHWKEENSSSLVLLDR